MSSLDQENMAAAGASFEGLASEFLSALARTAKNAGLYSLSHPMVTESLGRGYTALNGLIRAEGRGLLTVSHGEDAWLFNGNPVSCGTQDSANLEQMLKAHGVRGISFEAGVRVSELAALCAFLGSGVKNRPPGALGTFLSRMGVKRIKPEETHYVRESSYGGGAAAPSQERPEIRPRPAAASPAPESAPRPAARPQGQAMPAPRPEASAAKREVPVPKESGTGQSLRPAGKAKEGLGPAIDGKASGPAGGTAARKGSAATLKGSGISGGAGKGPGSGTGSGTGSGGGGGEGSGSGTGAGKGSGGASGEGGSGGASFGALLTQLVEAAVKDPEQRVKMYQDAMKMIKAGMDRQVAEATRKLSAEKEQILNTRTRTEKVLSNVADGKVIVDKDGKVLMMNSAAEEISGRRLHEVVGKHISEYLDPSEHYLTFSNDMNLTGNELTGEVSVSGDEQVGGALRRSMALLEDDEGRIVGAYMTLPEVSKFRETQRMQDEFLSKVTHDLKAPLSSISSALEMLTETAGKKLDGDENNFLAISIRNSQRLTEMIRGILDFSKLQEGKMPVSPEPCQLGPILKESVEGLMPWARTKGIALGMRQTPDVRVMADHQRIVQVLNNLVSNALKSTPPGGKVMVAASRAALPEPCAIVGIRDTGPGIPKKELERIFNRFEQLESGARREGVGLGLSIVREFIRLHKGRVWAESEEGKGTTFYFTLPLSG